MTEEWRPIPEWETLYEVSDCGRVRSLSRVTRGGFAGTRKVKGRIRKPVPRASGHVMVMLTDGEIRKSADIHRLVMVAFCGPCPDGMEVCHNNGDPTDNRLSNLRYGTRSENIYDMVKHGAHWQAKKTHCPRGHLLDGANNKRSRNGRCCKACAKACDYVRYHTAMKGDLQKIADSYYEQIMEKA